MQLHLVALALLGIASAGELSAAPPPAGRTALNRPCPDDPATHLARERRQGQFRKLTDLPPADAYAAVYRRGPDGCMIPVMYRDRQAPPAPRR